MDWQYQIVYESGVREIVSQRNIPGETFNQSMSRWLDEVQDYDGVLSGYVDLKLVNEHKPEFVQNFVTPC